MSGGVRGIGTDLVDISRVAAAVGRHGHRFAARILSADELLTIDSSDAAALAKAFAGKEAVAKALGTGFQRGVSWQDIHIARDDLGAPTVALSGGAAARAAALGAQQVLLSLADERTHVLAFAILV